MDPARRIDDPPRFNPGSAPSCHIGVARAGAALNCTAVHAIVDPGGLVIVENIYQFGGFREPVTAGVVNTVKAGSTVPVKWRITDANGNPVSDPASFVGLVAAVTTCATGLTEDAIETTSSNTGLQYLGNGVWQFNWKTPKTSTGCRQLRLTLADGSVHTAAFAFK